jgi:glyoxylase-like metal-dependent hydrolase (beta-lactamase superfamily II)
MEIAHGIHTVDRVRGANSYLVLSDGSAAVIDTGFSGNANRIIEYATSVGVEPGKLEYIILTHADIDHAGSAARLKELTGAKVAIHEADAPRLSGEKKQKEVKGAVGVLFRVMSPFMRLTPIKADVLLKDFDKVLGLTVIDTPGHTDGSISLYREKEAIFVGDALRTDSAGRPLLPPGPMTVDMEQAKNSVRKISTYQYSVLLPGHGPPMTHDASRIMADFVQRGFSVG